MQRKPLGDGVLLAAGVGALAGGVSGAIVFRQAARVASAASRFTGGFNEFLEGTEDSGTGFGKLTNRAIRVTQKGLNIVRDHLSNPFFEHAPENDAMIGRLESAMTRGVRVTGADASFYMHEVQEATLMRGARYTTEAYNAAHYAALTKFGVSRYSVYAPEVIQSMPGQFGRAFRDFWGIR